MYLAFVFEFPAFDFFEEKMFSTVSKTELAERIKRMMGTKGFRV